MWPITATFCGFRFSDDHLQTDYSLPYLISVLRMRMLASTSTTAVKTIMLGTEIHGDVGVTIVASGPSLIGTGASVWR